MLQQVSLFAANTEGALSQITAVLADRGINIYTMLATDSAEFGIIVRSDLKGQGLGRLMMDKLIRTLRAHGTQRLVATVLHDNKRMLALQRDLGFVERPDASGDGTRAIVLDLHPGNPAP